MSKVALDAIVVNQEKVCVSKVLTKKMVQGNDWLSLFNHIEKKSGLIKVANRFFRQAEFRSNLKTQMIFTEKIKMEDNQR